MPQMPVQGHGNSCWYRRFVIFSLLKSPTLIRCSHVVSKLKHEKIWTPSVAIFRCFKKYCCGGGTGVISVSLQGKYKDMVVVIGDGVDSVCLAKRLGKKLGHAILETVEEMEEKPVVRKPPTQSSNPSPVTHCASSCQQSPSELYAVVYDPSPSTCILMWRGMEINFSSFSFFFSG